MKLMEFQNRHSATTETMPPSTTKRRRGLKASKAATGTTPTGSIFSEL